MIEWIMKKSWILLLISLLAIISYHLWYIFDFKYIWYSIIIIELLFVYSELISIIENLIKLNSLNKKENKILNIIAKILWIWYKTIKNNIINNTNNNEK